MVISFEGRAARRIGKEDPTVIRAHPIANGISTCHQRGATRRTNASRDIKFGPLLPLCSHLIEMGRGGWWDARNRRDRRNPGHRKRPRRSWVARRIEKR